MYDTSFFKDNTKLLEWAQKSVPSSRRADPCVGFDGEINYVNVAKDLLLLYQLRKVPEGGLTVEMVHMLLFGARENLRKDIFRVDKFFKIDGEILWHSAINYGGRSPLPFAVANAWQEESFKKYSAGGCFEMIFAGLGYYLEEWSQRGALRFFSGNPLEMARKEHNDPTLPFADMDLSHMRSLNPSNDEYEPALAEFTGIVESCKLEMCCGEKVYRIGLWSGPMAEPTSFPWTLVVTASHIRGKYVPRVGDFIHGAAYMFGTFHGEAHEEPTVNENGVHPEEGTPSCEEPSAGTAYVDDIECEEADLRVTSIEKKPGDQSRSDGKKEETGEGKDWIWIPRKLDHYYSVTHHGKGLAASVKKTFPKFVVYADYRKKIRGKLVQVSSPNRKVLKSILDSIDYVITSKDNMRIFGDVFDSIGIRQMTRDSKTGEYHLWCCLGSLFGREHTRSHLMIALDDEMNVLRYTLHMGDRANLPPRGMSTQIVFQSDKSKGDRNYPTLNAGISAIAEMRKDDYIIACSLSHTSMVQAYCDEYDEKTGPRFTVEWQIHYLPWQFHIEDATAEEARAIFKGYDKGGVEDVQTMARWKWSKFKGNV